MNFNAKIYKRKKGKKKKRDVDPSSEFKFPSLFLKKSKNAFDEYIQN